MHFSCDNFTASTGSAPICCWYYELCQWKMLNHNLLLHNHDKEQLPHSLHPSFTAIEYIFVQFAIKTVMAFYGLMNHPKMMSLQLQDTHAPIPILLQLYHLFRFVCPFLFWDTAALISEYCYSLLSHTSIILSLLLFFLLSHCSRLLGEALVLNF